MAIQVLDIETVDQFSAVEMQPILLPQSEGLVALPECLEAGQEVRPCVITTRVLYLAFAGQGQLRVAGEQAELNAGSLAFMPAEVGRSLSAMERSRVLAVQVS